MKGQENRNEEKIVQIKNKYDATLDQLKSIVQTNRNFDEAVFLTETTYRNIKLILQENFPDPENKADAEAMSLNKHGSTAGPTFEELYNKNYEKAVKQGLNAEDAKNSAYQEIINSSKRPSEEVNKKYGAN